MAIEKLYAPEAPALTPAEKALNEQDVSESAEVAALRERLVERLHDNYLAYFDNVRNMETAEIIDSSHEISAITGAHYYLTEIHNFHTSELNYLLQFKEPLKVVADEFQWESAVEERSDIMWKVFHEQEALKNGKYALAEPLKETASVTVNSPVFLPDADGKGYIFSTADDSEFYIPNALHIERDDSMMVYESDEAAAVAAKRDGIPLISGIDGVPDDVYLDTPENRKIIEGHIFKELRQQLNERAEQNWEDYRHAPHNSTPENIYHQAVSVVAHRDAAIFIKDYDGFTAEELNCLLQFADPVDLVAGYLSPDSEISEMPGILYNIIEEQEEFKKQYALVEEPAEFDFEDADKRLQGRLADNFAAYKQDMLDLSGEALFNSAAEIASVSEAFDYFSNEHAFIESEVQFLLKFENPLELISDRWSDGIGGVKDVINAIFSEQERTLQSGSYELASDDPESPPTTVSTREITNNAVSSGEKPSVLDEIRQSRKEPQERGSGQKDQHNKKKSEQDL